MLAKLAAPAWPTPPMTSPARPAPRHRPRSRPSTRSAGQRHHDGLLAALRALLCSGELGQHNGLPAAIIVSTSLTELQSRAGHALTGGGTLLPTSDVIRLASHANHYHVSSTTAASWPLSHHQRLASPGQRIVPYAKDRGCSFPNCDVPGYLTEVHHVTDFAQCQETDINELTQGCGSPPPTGHHRGLDHPQTQKTAPPNGFPQPTSTMDNPAPTCYFTPENSCTTATKTIHERGATSVSRASRDQQPLPLVTVIA
ncbi:HNH endonuclease [Mycolicibacterium novocastrense]|nr:HNH endonuclease [Mycolicibacterium novocastrense]